MHTKPRAFALLMIATLACGVASACASSGGKAGARVAPNNQNITLEQQVAPGISRARIAWVKNGSSVPVVITQVSILACVNLKAFCGINATNVRVEPGERAEVIRIEAQDPSRPFNYRLQWRWRAASVATGRIAPGDTAALRRAERIALSEKLNQEALKYGDKVLNQNLLSAIGDNFAAMRAEPETVFVGVGSRLYIYEQLRVLGLDKAGKVMGRVRASMTWTVARSSAIRFLSPDTLQAESPGSTTVTMRLTPNALLDTTRAQNMKPVVFTVVAR